MATEEAQHHLPKPQQQRRKGIGVREWLVISDSGHSHVHEVGKYSIMRRTGLPARDLRALDPVLSYPSSILGRERAIVVNLEHIKAIITAKEVLMLNTTNPLVIQFVQDLKQRITNDDVVHSNVDVKVTPFEFRALEACLESACQCLESETKALEEEAYPALDELTSKISTLNLERVRQIKSRLVAISGRVQKVRDELEHLLDDDNDMAEMYLTEKLAARLGDQNSAGDFNPELAEAEEREDGEERDDESKSEEDSEIYVSIKPDIEELEMLLEAYFAQIDGILQKLAHMSEYVDDTEDFINIMLDDKQNQLLQMGVLLSAANMILNAGIVVFGVLGMNIHISLFDGTPKQFWETAMGVVGGIVGLYVIAVAWGKKKKLLAL